MILTKKDSVLLPDAIIWMLAPVIGCHESGDESEGRSPSSSNTDSDSDTDTASDADTSSRRPEKANDFLPVYQEPELMW